MQKKNKSSMIKCEIIKETPIFCKNCNTEIGITRKYTFAIKDKPLVKKDIKEMYDNAYKKGITEKMETLRTWTNISWEDMNSGMKNYCQKCVDIKLEEKEKQEKIYEKQQETLKKEQKQQETNENDEIERKLNKWKLEKEEIEKIIKKNFFQDNENKFYNVLGIIIKKDISIVFTLNNNSKYYTRTAFKTNAPVILANNNNSYKYTNKDFYPKLHELENYILNKSDENL